MRTDELDDDERWRDGRADDSGDFVVDEHVDDEETEVVECPHCGEDVAGIAIQCPHCRNYLSQEDRPSPRKPRWFIVVAVLLILVFTGLLSFL